MKSAVALLAIVSGIGIGYLIGRYMAPGDSGADRPGGEAGTVAPSGGQEAGAAQPSSPTVPSDGRSPQARIRELVALTSWNQRSFEMEQYLAGLSAAEMPAVLTALQELPAGRMRFHLVGQLFERWGTLDGAAALTVAGHMPARERWHNESQALLGWARSDPREAWKVAKALAPDNPTVPVRIAGAFRELARVDLNGAIQESIQAPEMRKHMFRELILEVAADSGKLESAMQSALQMPAAEDREAWINDIFRRWGSADSAAPMGALRSIPDAALARTAMNGMLAGWGELDPMGALDFALENGGDPLVAGALGSMLRDSARSLREPEMLALLETARAKGAYDVVAPQLLNQMSMHQPAKAIELAATLTDENQRNGVVRDAIAMWAHHDMAAAVAHFESMPVSSAKLEALPGLSRAALRMSDGPEKITRWMDSFTGADRVQAAEHLVGTLENHVRYARDPLPPESAAVLAQAIGDTPDLPEDIREKSRQLLNPALAP